jgi:hypothetical protein
LIVGALSRGSLVAGLAALALFVVMFMSWFGDAGQAAEDAEEVRRAAEILNVDAAPTDDTTDTAWQAFGWFGLAILIGAIGLGISFAVVTYTRASVSLPIALSSTTAGAGLLAVVYVFFRILNPPGDGEVDREVGLFLGLLASAGIALGGWLGMQDDPP